MTHLILTSDNTLPFVQQAMHDQFQKGGTYGSVALTIAGLAAMVVMVYALQRWYDATHHGKDESSHPIRLFRELLRRMNVSQQEREMITQIARDQRCKNPAALLISDRLFDEYTGAWRAKNTRANTGVELDALRERLFGCDHE